MTLLPVTESELPRPTWSAKRVAQVMDCDLSRVYKLLHAGKLAGKKDGRSVRIFVDSVVAYQNSNLIGGPAVTAEKNQRRATGAATRQAIERLRELGCL